MESYTRIFIHLNPAPDARGSKPVSALEARSPRAALRMGLNGPTALRWSRTPRDRA